MLIPCPRLPIVTMLAKRLPVILVPEQHRISPVWLDMVDHRCWRQFSGPFTLDAKRVVCQELLARHLPAMVVAAFKRASSFASMQRSMKLAILTVSQTRTAVMLAWFIWLHGHEHWPPLPNEKPSKLAAPRAFSSLLFSYDMILHPQNTSKRTSADILQKTFINFSVLLAKVSVRYSILVRSLFAPLCSI